MGEVRVEFCISVFLVTPVHSEKEEVPKELEKSNGEDLVGQATDHDVRALLGRLVHGQCARGHTTPNGLEDDGYDVTDDEDEGVLHWPQDRELLAEDEGQLGDDVVNPGHHETGGESQADKLHDESVEVLDVFVGPDTADVTQDLECHAAGPACQEPPLVVEDTGDNLESEKEGVHHQEGDVTAKRGVVTLVKGFVVEHVEHDLRGPHGLGHEGRLDGGVCGCGSLL